MSLLSQFSTSPIKSIQTGTVTINGGNTSDSASITAVSTSKSFVIHNGCYGSNTALADFMCSLALSSSTTVTATRSGVANTTTAAFTVVEFY